ncbi:hypothetical protein MR829_08145 [Paracoccus versutus]|uniref:hypothetical protein n=1 Tax=Paracoccus versutus TaxID=34007 RepID=UPI001FB61F4A|nr:hypothetical protein [Paracoccus versutus]MCJ1900346.1 hypothetical protein [Paracoccus versutus]
MRFYLLPVKAEINLASREVTHCFKSASKSDAPVVTHISVSPMEAMQPKLESQTIHFAPATVLHLSLRDLLTVLTAIHVVYWQRRGRAPTYSELENFFLGNHRDSFRLLVNLSANRRLPGEFGASQARAFRQDPDFWEQLQAAIQAELKYDPPRSH